MIDPKKHPRKRELESIMREFEKISRSSKILDFILEEAGEYAEKRTDCSDLYGDYDEGPISPSVNLYEIHEDEWLPKLRKADKKFDDLCKKFIEVYMSALDDNRKSWQEAEEWLSETVDENFWAALPEEYTDELEDVWDELREDCDDQAAERRDPYGYRGLSRRDFMASDRRDPMASEKKNLLIKLAASLPKGDKSRRAILAGLNKSSYGEDHDDVAKADAEYYFDKVDSSILSGLKRMDIKIRKNGRSDHEFFEEDSLGAVGEWSKDYTITSPRGHIDISVRMYHNPAGDPLWYYYAVTGGADWIPSSGWGKIDGEVEEEDPRRFVDKVLKDIEAILARASVLASRTRTATDLYQVKVSVFNKKYDDFDPAYDKATVSKALFHFDIRHRPSDIEEVSKTFGIWLVPLGNHAKKLSSTGYLHLLEGDYAIEAGNALTGLTL